MSLSWAPAPLQREDGELARRSLSGRRQLVPEQLPACQIFEGMFSFLPLFFPFTLGVELKAHPC